MKRLFGGLLLAAGVLIAGASGLCTVVVLVTGLGELGSVHLPEALLFGGVPFGIGLGLLLGGRALLRSARNQPPEDQR